MTPTIDARNLLELSESALISALTDVSAVLFDKADGDQLFAISAYASTLELISGINVLFRNDHISGVPVVLRALLEQYADLRASLRQRGYFKMKYANFLGEKIRMLRYVEASPDDEFLRPLANSIESHEERNVLEGEMVRLRAAGFGPVNVFRRFELAGMVSEYRSIYWQLCLHSHNSVSTLDDRHVTRVGDEYRVTLFKESNPEDMIRHLDSVLAILIDSSEEIHDYFEVSGPRELSGLWSRFQSIRSGYHSHAGA